MPKNFIKFIEVLPDEVEVCEYGNVCLCLNCNFKDAEITWQVSENAGKCWKDLKCEDNLCLKFKAKPRYDQNFYRAFIKKDSKTYITNSARLFLLSKPRIIEQPQNQFAFLGDSVTFTVQFAGIPTPTVQWQFDPNGKNIWKNIPGATQEKYTIDSVTEKDYGKYRVCFTNTCGTIYSNTAILYNGSENFDSYQNGDSIIVVSPLFTAWSEPPLPQEKAKVSNEQSFSTPNSLKILRFNDVVATLPTVQTSGKYRISFKEYVTNFGYFNIQERRPWGQVYKMQLVFRPNELIQLQADGLFFYPNSYQLNEWTDVRIDIDLDADSSSIYVNNILLRTYQFSKNYDGNQTVPAFQGVDFFGNSISPSFIDNVKICKLS